MCHPSSGVRVRKLSLERNIASTSNFWSISDIFGNEFGLNLSKIGLAVLVILYGSVAVLAPKFDLRLLSPTRTHDWGNISWHIFNKIVALVLLYNFDHPTSMLGSKIDKIKKLSFFWKFVWEVNWETIQVHSQYSKFVYFRKTMRPGHTYELSLVWRILLKTMNQRQILSWPWGIDFFGHQNCIPNRQNKDFRLMFISVLGSFKNRPTERIISLMSTIYHH